jgi:predicted metal-binding protein
MADALPCLHVCITCRAGQPLAEGVKLPGVELHAAIAGLLDGSDAPAVELRSVECLASCERGCTATISMAGKWGYLLGGLSAADAADLLTYAASYGASRTGTIMPSRRPASLKSAIVARFPTQGFPSPEFRA